MNKDIYLLPKVIRKGCCGRLITCSNFLRAWFLKRLTALHAHITSSVNPASSPMRNSWESWWFPLIRHARFIHYPASNPEWLQGKRKDHEKEWKGHNKEMKGNAREMKTARNQCIFYLLRDPRTQQLKEAYFSSIVEVEGFLVTAPIKRNISCGVWKCPCRNVESKSHTAT